MESTDSSAAAGAPPQPHLPPGFRFHPTDEELVVHYLKKKASSAPLPVAIIAEVDLYKFDPWELPAKAAFGEQEWYFFSPRDRKYPNGARPNRAATSGYWKATGTDKPVLTSGGTQIVGVKKALVFYGGKPPKGVKTNWIMHEYRLADKKVNMKPPGCDTTARKGSLRLDDWVLCRIYKKNAPRRPSESEDLMEDMLAKLHTPKAANNYNSYMENDSLLDIPMGESEASSLKRMVPPLFWNEVGSSSSSTKRFQGNNELMSEENMGGGSNNSIASLLSQLPQTPQLHHQSMLDGVFRQPYQMPGLNWYS